jgi:DNA primase
VANQLIDDVLNSTDIVDVVSRYVPLKRAGSNFV